MAIAQTADGFLWLATEEGLVRYNGRTFVTFDERNAPGLGDRFIRSLATGPDGSLWIGTMSGLAHYKDGKFQSLRNEPPTRVDIYDLCVDRDGSVWFSSDQGLRQLRDGKLRVYTTSDGLPSNGISGIAKSQDGTLWIATTKGLARFQAGRFTAYTTWDGGPAVGLNTIADGKDGSVWIGTTNGRVGRWQDGRITTWWDGKATRDSRVESLREDVDGNLWIAFENVGVARMNGRKLEIFTKSDGLPSNNPDWVFEERLIPHVAQHARSDVRACPLEPRTRTSALVSLCTSFTKPVTSWDRDQERAQSAAMRSQDAARRRDDEHPLRVDRRVDEHL